MLALAVGVTVSVLASAPAELTYSVTPSAVAYTQGTQSVLSLQIVVASASPQSIPAPVIVFVLPVGCSGGDLVSGSDVPLMGAAAPPGWTIQSNGRGVFRATPPPRTLRHGDRFTFTFSRVIVNDQPGLATITVFEGELPRIAAVRVAKVVRVATVR